MKELGIYIHIPFCKKKCDYCDFVSFSGATLKAQDSYIQALLDEIENAPNVGEYLVTTIYIGGGTPSYINPEHIQKLMEKIVEKFYVTEKAEVTIEVNPGTVDDVKLKSYKASGINRLSIGLQTTNDKMLKKIGRIHTYEDFLDTYIEARKAGFKNINVDLIIIKNVI